MAEHLDNAVQGSDEQKNLRALTSKLNGDGEIDKRDFKDTGITPDELKENNIHMNQKSFENKRTGKTHKKMVVDMDSSGGFIKEDIGAQKQKIAKSRICQTI